MWGLKKDGGQESRVWGYWLIELKQLFSIVLLRFEDGSREAYHSHAFNAISWVLRGKLVEFHIDGRVEVHTPSLRPIITTRDTFHMVESRGRTWVFSLRGPWADTWREYIPGRGEVVLAHGRIEVPAWQVAQYGREQVKA